MSNRLIITAASAAFGERLLAWLGALSANWPTHPPVRIYDLGLDDSTRSELLRHNIDLRKVPPFCPHWRLHFTWKMWCWEDAPASHVLWLDAGTVVLDSLEEVFEGIEKLGYFAIPNYRSLAVEASAAAIKGCGLPTNFSHDKPTIAGNVFGFDKADRLRRLITEALAVAMVEENIKATAPEHRHDQAIVSLLLHKHFSPVFLFDGRIYGSAGSPCQVPGQKIWAHRWRMRPEDLNALRNRVGGSAGKYIPGLPVSANQTILSKIKSRARTVQSMLLPDHRKPAIYDGVRD
jgi:hypothetical protein